MDSIAGVWPSRCGTALTPPRWYRTDTEETARLKEQAW